MTTRSSVLHISKLVFSAFVITIFATALHPGVGVIAAGSNHTTTARPALSQPENDLAFALLQEEPSHLELFYMDAPQLRVKERAIYVYLPPDYFTSEKSYPVLYLHDGSMVFSTNGGHDSRFNQVLNRMFKDGETEGVIMVGVASSFYRWDEYSPWVNENMDIWGTNSTQVEGGEGDAYLEFFVNTLKPEIDSRYRTLPDRENTAIGGFSMGGLISLYAGLKYPEVFSKVMAQSTAVWFAETDGTWLSNNQLLNLIAQTELPQNVRFYMDIGTNEWADKLVYVRDEQGNQLTYPFVWKDGTEKVFAALQAHGVPEENLKLVIEEGGEHEAVNWRGRFDDAIRFLFAESVVVEPTPTAVELSPTAIVVIPTETVVMPAEPEATTAPVNPTEITESEMTAAAEDIMQESADEEDAADESNIVLLVTGVLLILFSIFVLSWLLRSNTRSRSG